MADRPTQLLLDALSRAVAEPAGLPLYAGKTSPGLFPTTAPARQAAQRCKDDGLLRVVRTETRGKTILETCAVTDKGLAYLLHQASPRQVLEDFVRTLEARQDQVGTLVAAAQQTRANFEALKAAAEKVLQQLRPAGGGQPAPATGPDPHQWAGVILDRLAHWRPSGVAEDCPLPQLYQSARQALPALTIGHFHDSLRLLYDQEKIYLHPWTGPLYDLPEPPYALLVGHEIAYYASRK